MTNIVWPDLFFRFAGRISRTQWWIGVVILVVVGSVNGWVNRAVMPEDGITTVGPALIQIVTFVIGIALLWPALAVSVKRWHDRDKSGWWILIGFVPLIGQIWAIVELGFLAGSEGPNRYGPSPLGHNESGDPNPRRSGEGT